MARVLIVPCGCRGQALARELVAAGHAVRGTTRSPDRTTAIAEAGAEPYVGDPDRIGTLMGALAGVTVKLTWAGADGDILTFSGGSVGGNILADGDNDASTPAASAACPWTWPPAASPSRS